MRVGGNRWISNQHPPAPITRSGRVEMDRNRDGMVTIIGSCWVLDACISTQCDNTSPLPLERVVMVPLGTVATRPF